MKTAFVLAAALATAQAADIQPLILGGTTVPAGQKTYTVGLRSTASGRNFCGGTLISPTHVLTAAHCSGGIRFVSIGSSFISGSSDGERIAVRKETLHPLWNERTFNYDISILELETPSRFPPASLLDADSETFVGASATAMGWGTTSPGGSQSSRLLRVNVPVRSDAQCKAARVRGYPISETMFCAGGERNRDSCQGDSGGPLILEGVLGDALIGVVSWGESCGRVGKPGVYTKPNVVKSWIEATAPNATWVQ